MEEEISLRELIEVPLRYWRYIVLLSLGAALIAFVASSLMPVRYRAEAHLIIRMTKADVKTVGQPLKSLALSGVVARAVLQRMEGRLEPAMRSTGSGLGGGQGPGPLGEGDGSRPPISGRTGQCLG